MGDAEGERAYTAFGSKIEADSDFDPDADEVLLELEDDEVDFEQNARAACARSTKPSQPSPRCARIISRLAT